MTYILRMIKMDDDLFAFLAVIGLLGVVVIGLFAAKMGSFEEFCDRVDDKWIKNYDDSSKYLISTENHGILENTDELLTMKFDSSDFYARIKVNQTYCFRTVGWRVPFLSWYKNIVEVEEYD